MVLSLTDPRWNELPGSYGRADDIVKWLSEALEARGLSDNRLGDLINEVAHQGDASLALYAVVPYLVDLASKTEGAQRFDLLTSAGHLYAAAGKAASPSCPDFLQSDYQNAASIGARLLAPLLPNAKSFDDFKYGVAAMAGLVGHLAFARQLELFDLYEGQIHHAYFERPVSELD